MVFLWVILYGLVYISLAACDADWMLPLGMLSYTAVFLLWIGKTGYSGKIGLEGRPAFSWGMLPLLTLPAANLLTGGFCFHGWETEIVLICACVVEELFFRGFLLHWLLEKGRERAVMGTSILFGLMHLSNLPAGADTGYTLVQVLCAFWVSICYCRVTLFWGSLVPCMAAHILTNLTAAGRYSDGRWLAAMVAVMLICVCYSLWLKNLKKEITP